MGQRLIDAKEIKEVIVDALDAIKEALGTHSHSIIDAVIHAVCKTIDSAPTIDPEPVTRCMECSNRIRICGTPYCTFWERNVEDDWYCSQGDNCNTGGR